MAAESDRHSLPPSFQRRCSNSFRFVAPFHASVRVAWPPSPVPSRFPRKASSSCPLRLLKSNSSRTCFPPSPLKEKNTQITPSNERRRVPSPLSLLRLLRFPSPAVCDATRRTRETVQRSPSFPGGTAGAETVRRTRLRGDLIPGKREGRTERRGRERELGAIGRRSRERGT